MLSFTQNKPTFACCVWETVANSGWCGSVRCSEEGAEQSSRFTCPPTFQSLLWSWTLCSDQKNEIVDTSDQNKGLSVGWLGKSKICNYAITHSCILIWQCSKRLNLHIQITKYYSWGQSPRTPLPDLNIIPCHLWYYWRVCSSDGSCLWVNI